MKKKLNIYTKCLIFTTSLCSIHISFCSSPTNTVTLQNNSGGGAATASTNQTLPDDDFTVIDDSTTTSSSSSNSSTSAPTIDYLLKDIGKQDKTTVPKRDNYRKGALGSFMGAFSTTSEQSSLETDLAYIEGVIASDTATAALEQSDSVEFRGSLNKVLLNKRQAIKSKIDTIFANFDQYEQSRLERRKSFEAQERKIEDAFIKQLRNNFTPAAQELHRILSVYILAAAKDTAPKDMVDSHTELTALSTRFIDRLKSFTQQRNKYLEKFTEQQNTSRDDLKKQIEACDNALQTLIIQTKTANPNIK